MPRLPLKRYELICSLMASGLRMREIAKRLGITRQALYDITRSEGFQTVYKEIQSELLTGAKEVVVGGAIAASKLMVELVEDDRHEMRDRLQAAKFLAETSGRFLERLEEKEKKDADAAKPDWLLADGDDNG
jgi:transcriptional regulator with XRE-family HTH domain